MSKEILSLEQLTMSFIRGFESERGNFSDKRSIDWSHSVDTRLSFEGIMTMLLPRAGKEHCFYCNIRHFIWSSGQLAPLVMLLWPHLIVPKATTTSFLLTSVRHSAS